jgi:hypothetical protein
MDYQLDIIKIKEMNNNDYMIRYYNFLFTNENNTSISFVLSVLVKEGQLLFSFENNVKLLDDFIDFNNKLKDDTDCQFLFVDNNNLLRYISYQSSTKTFSIGMLVNELTFDINIKISDYSRLQFNEAINNFINS